jgi:aspartate kinase
VAEKNTVEGFVIRSVELNRTEGKITMVNVQDKPGVVARIFQALAERSINVNLIVQTSRPDGTAYVTFTVPRETLPQAADACEAVKAIVGATEVEADPGIATVSVIGVGMRSHTDVARRMFAVLARNNVNIDLISTSEIEIECVVKEAQADIAHQALLQEFKGELE